MRVISGRDDAAVAGTTSTLELHFKLLHFLNIKLRNIAEQEPLTKGFLFLKNAQNNLFRVNKAATDAVSQKSLQFFFPLKLLLFKFLRIFYLHHNIF